METTAHELLHQAKADGRKLRDAIPDVYSGYVRMGTAAMSDGELPAKFKELIALAIAVTRECDGCIAAHARGAASRGATDQEVAEMLGVTILMNGGPGTVWGPRAYAAYQEFASDLAAGGYAAPAAEPPPPAPEPAPVSRPES
jgi:AhpD family alkylhydroperoxidase